MSIQERAKQFASFDALKGFDEALEKVLAEKGKQERILLAPEEAEELNKEILTLEKDQLRHLNYYAAGRYHDALVKIDDVDFIYHRVTVIHQGKKIVIPFNDLYEL